MKDTKSNPLKNFFKISTKCLSEDVDIKFTDTINLLFRCLSDDSVTQTGKSDLLNDLTEKLKAHRFYMNMSPHMKNNQYIFFYSIYI